MKKVIIIVTEIDGSLTVERNRKLEEAIKTAKQKAEQHGMVEAGETRWEFPHKDGFIEIFEV